MCCAHVLAVVCVHGKIRATVIKWIAVYVMHHSTVAAVKSEQPARQRYQPPWFTFRDPRKAHRVEIPEKPAEPCRLFEIFIVDQHDGGIAFDQERARRGYLKFRH